jgi:hypothetical protein
MRQNIFFFCLAFVLFTGTAVAGETAIPPDTDLSKIFQKPAVIGSSVTEEAAADRSQWITMEADVQVCTPLPLETLRTAARDYENYSGVFKRIKRDKVTRSPQGVFVEMSVSVGLMGITYDTTYTVLVDEQIDTPSRLLLDFSFVSSDGNVQDAHGIWYLESVLVNGSPATYARYTAHGKVLKKYPLQKTIMGTFINQEHIDLMNQFLKAASKLDHRAAEP